MIICTTKIFQRHGLTAAGDEVYLYNNFKRDPVTKPNDWIITDAVNYQAKNTGAWITLQDSSG